MNKSFGRAAVVLSVAALALTACSDKDEPSTTPTPTSSSSSATPSTSGSATPSSTASASPSTNASVPAAARARTEAGAIAFLTFFFDEINRGQTEPGSVDLAVMSDKGCISCKRLQSELDDYVTNGWSTRQAPVRALEPALATEATADKVIINFTFEQMPVDYYKDGAAAGKLTASKGKRAAAIRWVSGAWQMFDMEKV